MIDPVLRSLRPGWHVSVPALSAEAFLSRLKDRGWPAEEAFIAYQEWREFACPCLAREGCPGHGTQRVLLNSRLAGALESMNEPGDLQQYLRMLPELANGATPPWIEPQTKSEIEPGTAQALENRKTDRRNEKAPLSTPFWTVMTAMYGWADEAQKRQRLQNAEPAAWGQIREVGMSWEDVREVVQRDTLDREQTLTNFVPQQGLSQEDALAQLAHALEESGVSYFSWPAVTGAAPNEVQLLAAEVRHVNGELEDATGWKGPLLGLGGRMHLELGIERENSGVCFAGNPQLIRTGAKIVWTSFAHEWLHALDAQMSPRFDQKTWSQIQHTHQWFASDASKQSAQASNVEVGQAWKRLLSELNDPSLSVKERERLAREVVSGVRHRWTNAHNDVPELTEAVLRECAEPTETWSRQEAFLRLRPLIQQRTEIQRRRNHEKPPKEDNIDFNTEYAITDIEMAREFADRSKTNGSIWVQYRARLDRNTARHASLKQWGSYFQTPTEQAAFSFEAMLPVRPNRLCSDVDRNHHFLTYPLRPDVTHQKMAWKRFFRSATDWWNRQKYAFLPAPQPATAALNWGENTSLAARIRARRAQESRAAAARPAVPKKSVTPS